MLFASAVHTTVAVVGRPPPRVTTAAPAFVAVLATQVAAVVISQFVPSINRYSSASATFVIVIVIAAQVSALCDSESATSALVNHWECVNSNCILGGSFEDSLRNSLKVSFWKTIKEFR